MKFGSNNKLVEGKSQHLGFLWTSHTEPREPTETHRNRNKTETRQLQTNKRGSIKS